MLTRSLKRLGAILGLALLPFSPAPVFAQDGPPFERVNRGEEAMIFRYNRCYVVDNGSVAPIMVPLGSVSEWWGPNSFILNAADIPGIVLRKCQTRWDMMMCRTTSQDESLSGGDMCNNSAGWRIYRVNGTTIIPSGTSLSWSNGLDWAAANPGRSHTARPEGMVPACYTNSNMDRIANAGSYYNGPTGDKVYDDIRDNGLFIPIDSDYCIARFSARGFNSSEGRAGASSGMIRIWRN